MVEILRLKTKAKNIALKHIEELAKEQVELFFDDALDLAVEELKKAIPGKIDDAVLALIIPAIKEPLKKAILQTLDKIYAD
jgi:hypothetical protein